MATSEAHLADSRRNDVFERVARVHDLSAIRHVRSDDRQHIASVHGAPAGSGPRLYRELVKFNITASCTTRYVGVSDKKKEWMKEVIVRHFKAT